MSSPAPEELAGVELFRTLTDEQRSAVAGWLEVEQVVPGQRLTREDANGYVFYVLREGAAEVTVEGRPVRTLGPGDYFGEVSLVFGPQQTATVTATTDAVVWRMFGTAFRQLQQSDPAVAAVLEQTAAARLQTPTA